jgi:hypothetical protein
MSEPEATDLPWEGARAGDPAVRRLGWYINRLRCMSAAEICHRALRAAALRAEHWGLGSASEAPTPDLSRVPRAWIRRPAAAKDTGCIDAAERIAEGRFNLFALHDVALGAPPRWNRDPKTGVNAPLRFGKLLDYRDSLLVGDIKYLWELNRHGHLVTLAQAFALTGRQRYLDVIRRDLESWFAECPYPLGPNWSSALECALRLVSWSSAWQLLDSPRGEILHDVRFRDRWLRSIFQHAEFIRGYFSRYSSANNHLLGEAAGLFIASLTWPFWPQARVWRRRTKDILERETLLQNGADGVNREQAVAYQRFELELLLLCRLAGEANGERFSEAFRCRIEAMLEYLASIMDAAGNVPMIGDSDDAIVLRLEHGPGFSGYRALLAMGAVLFRRAEFKGKAGALDERTRWLISDAEPLYAGLEETSPRLPPRRDFPDGGYHILGCDFETSNEIRLVVDAGAIGYPSIAAHGHADALAFTLCVGGSEFLVDPGTYAYHSHKAWRDYFRGTAAHNTVRVDGVDQSESGGNFMWTRRARAGCAFSSSTEEQDVFEGWHDGYKRLADPVVHRRRITLEKRRRRIVIEDVLEMSERHTVELFFHCSEHCRVRSTSAGYVISVDDRSLVLDLPQRPIGTARLYCGSLNPILGWISRRFDERCPAPTIAWRGTFAGHTVLHTRIGC